MGGAMDFITPAMWAMKLLLTKVIEKNGEKLGETGANLLGKLTNDIGKKISAESAQQLADQPGKLNSGEIAEIAEVIKNNPELAIDLQKLSAEVNRDIQLVLAMEQLLKTGNYDPSIQSIMEQISDQLNNLKWELSHPPAQIDNLVFPNGIVPISCPFYVGHDEIQTQCQKAITQPSGLLRIQAPPQMGKTSLLKRLVANIGLNYRIVSLDLQDVDSSSMKDFDQFLQWLCRQICNQLKVQITVNDKWDCFAGCKENCTAFIETYILHSVNRPLLLCIDNLEIFYSYHENYYDFLSLLRSWSDRKNSIWDSLRIILLHVFSLDDEDIHHSPFNIGQRVRLPELTPIQVQDLVVLHKLNWHDRHIAELMELVGGHPFLIRLALYEVTQGRILLQSLLITADHEGSLYSEHLQRHFRRLEREPELKKIMRQVVQSDRPLFIASTLLPRLRDLGMIKYNDNYVEAANQLYRSYFCRRL
jgi:AAA-like domain